MTLGTFVAVVGPSGAGKDTLLERALAGRPDIVRARRVITRPPSPDTEDFVSVTEREFEGMAMAGQFALTWHAHKLSYGIPSSVRDSLQAGRHVVANLSRRVWPEAKTRFPGAILIWVTAPTEVLAERLAARGREDVADIEARLNRVTDAPPPEAVLIDNGGALEAAVAVLGAALPQPVRG